MGGVDEADSRVGTIAVSSRPGQATRCGFAYDSRILSAYGQPTRSRHSG